MADVPELYGSNHRGFNPTLFVDDEPLTDEERDLAAVTVACHRRGWRLDFLNGEEWEVYKPDVGKYGQSCVGPTPAEAYSRALTASEGET